jgi:hypothetical protein
VGYLEKPLILSTTLDVFFQLQATTDLPLIENPSIHFYKVVCNYSQSGCSGDDAKLIFVALFIWLMNDQLFSLESVSMQHLHYSDDRLQ